MADWSPGIDADSPPIDWSSGINADSPPLEDGCGCTWLSIGVCGWDDWAITADDATQKTANKVFFIFIAKIS